MSEKKYLYSINRLGNTIDRDEISRETDCYYFLGHGSSETKVSKKTMRIRLDKWTNTLYRIETQEILARYNYQQMCVTCKDNIVKLNSLKPITPEFAQDIENLCKKYLQKV